MRYLPLTDLDRLDMLARIGVARVDDLFADVPDALLLKDPLDLPRRKTELQVSRHLGKLAARNVALVHAEGERAPSPLDTIGRTADFAYLRLRAREGYDAAAVATWAERLQATRASGKDVYAYFRHDDDGSNGVAAELLRDALL